MQPAAFGKTLYLWENHWQEQQQDAALQGWLDRLAQFIRERDVPDPTEEPVGDDL